MAIDKGREYAMRVLRRLGFEVEPIPEGIPQTADIRASHSGDYFVIECKQKHHDTFGEKSILDRIVKGEVVAVSESHDGRNAIAKQIRKAAGQIESTVSDENTFRCIWIQTVGIDQDLRWKQVFNTFYGSTYATTLADNILFPAFYVDHSAAFHHPDIDGLFLVGPKGLSLLLNEFSPRYEELKAIAFCKQYSCGVLDPQSHVRDGLAVALTGDADRSTDASIEAALSAKAGHSIRLIRMMQHSASSFVPDLQKARKSQHI